MRINVSGYLCAGVDLEELGSYRLSYRKEGLFRVTDRLSLRTHKDYSDQCPSVRDHHDLGQYSCLGDSDRPGGAATEPTRTVAPWYREMQNRAEGVTVPEGGEFYL